MSYDLRSLGGCKPKPARERFDASYMPEPMSGCWLWLGSPRGANGYGRIVVDGVVNPAHRFSWTLHYGPIPPDKYVLHRCDTPLCVNPDHLFLGTHKDNSDDKVKKGRQARGKRLARAQGNFVRRGELNPHSRLTEKDALAILRDRRPQRVVAERFGVTQSAVWSIKNGRTWAYLQEKFHGV